MSLDIERGPSLRKWVVVLAGILLSGCIASMRTGNLSCDVLPGGIWNHLSVDDANSDRAAMRLLEIVRQDANKRDRIVHFVETSLAVTNSPSLQDQYKLALLANALRFSGATPQELTRLAERGKHHREYYGLALSTLPSSPEFIMRHIELVKGGSILMPTADWEHGGKTNADITVLVVESLEESTGKEFGRDHGKWSQWWSTEGKFLKYDPRTSRYIHEEAKRNHVSTKDK